MPDISLEQAVYVSRAGSDASLLARSPGFLDEWLPLAERLCAAFGERPPGLACPACVFAQPFGKRYVAVVQVVDQGADYAGRPAALAFHFLILGRSDYLTLGGDPFLIADQFPATGTARRDLPTLTWPTERPSERTVEQVRQVLQREADGPNLLGGAQVLVDGGHLVFERSQPDTELL